LVTGFANAAVLSRAYLSKRKFQREQQAMTGSFDLVGGRLIDGTGTEPKRASIIRIENGRISAIWDNFNRPGDVKPADVIVDVTGKTVMPGLIDAHCHLSYGEGRSMEEVDVYGGPEWAAVRGVWNAAKVLQAGVTSVCDPGSVWLASVATRDAVNSGMFPGPRIMAAGRHISTEGGFADYFPTWVGMPPSAEGVLCSTREEMVQEVRRQVKNRVDLIKVSGDSQAQDRLHDAGPCVSDEELSTIVNTARRLGRKTTIHARYAETVLAAIRAKMDWVLHASFLRRQDLGFVRDSNIPLCPTITFTANVVEWGKEAGVDPGYIETKKRELDAMASIHRRAHEAGIPMMMGSETGFAVTPYGEWHSRELELMVKFVGLSSMEAIVAATRTNATVFGWDKDVGTLEPGRCADLLVIDGDPLDDIAVLSDPQKIIAIYKDGVEVQRPANTKRRARLSHERVYHVSSAWLHRSGPEDIEATAVH
jgi:imidazolonepropionase-like amidohydrolase